MFSKNHAPDSVIRSGLRHFNAYIAYSILVSVLIRLLSLVPALLMKRVIDEYIPQSDAKAAISCILLFVLIPLISGCVTALYRKSVIKAGRRLGNELFQKSFEKLVYQDVSFFDNHNSGEMATYCRSEAMDYVMIKISDIPQLIASIISGIITFILLLQTEPLIALAQLLYIPLLLIPSHYLSNITKKYSEKMSSFRAETNQIVNDTFRGIRTIKTLGAEDAQISKLKKINADSLVIWGRLVGIENLHGVWLTSFVDSLFIGVSFCAAAIRVINGNMQIGSLLVILNYLPILFSVIKEISKTNFNIMKAEGTHAQLFHMLEMEDGRHLKQDSKGFVFDHRITYDHVDFSYSDDRGNVLSNFCITIVKGKWVCIIGESGSGKTTFADLLIGFYTPNRGNIYIDDNKITEINRMSIHKHVMKVSQDTFLFSGSLRDNLALANSDLTDQDMINALHLVKLEELIDELPEGLNSQIGENGVQLSGGQRQRIALAQAILRKSEVLILDEITSNLDEKTEKDIIDTLVSLRERLNWTVICITHRPSLLAYADETYTIKDGKAVQI